jgi:hypothetical protein
MPPELRVGQPTVQVRAGVLQGGLGLLDLAVVPAGLGYPRRGVGCVRGLVDRVEDKAVQGRRLGVGPLAAADAAASVVRVLPVAAR